jgi:hypothetical protein
MNRDMLVDLLEQRIRVCGKPLDRRAIVHWLRITAELAKNAPPDSRFEAEAARFAHSASEVIRCPMRRRVYPDMTSALCEGDHAFVNTGFQISLLDAIEAKGVTTHVHIEGGAPVIELWGSLPDLAQLQATNTTAVWKHPDEDRVMGACPVPLCDYATKPFLPKTVEKRGQCSELSELLRVYMEMGECSEFVKHLVHVSYASCVHVNVSNFGDPRAILRLAPLRGPLRLSRDPYRIDWEWFEPSFQFLKDANIDYLRCNDGKNTLRQYWDGLDANRIIALLCFMDHLAECGCVAPKPVPTWLGSALPKPLSDEGTPQEAV